MRQPATLRALEFTQDDESLDEDGMAIALNPLPVKCRVCGMTDHDTISEPYLLRRAAANASGDYLIAYVGNFLIKERMREIVDFVAPGSFDCFRTALVRGNEPTPWILAVPKHQADSTIVRMNDEISRCPACDEYRECHVNAIAEGKLGFTSHYDVAKAADWFSWDRKQESAPAEPDRGMRHEACLAAGTEFLVRKGKRQVPSRPISFSRWGVLSVRMYALIKTLGIKGRYPCAEKEDIVPNDEEMRWVNFQVERLRQAGLVPNSDTTPKQADVTWFDDWLHRMRNKNQSVEALACQQKCGITLPDTFIRFAEKVGTMTFRNLEDNGLQATIRRRPEILVLDSEDPDVTGPVVAFADTNCGDQFCFHFGKELSEPEVVRYNHEADCVDSYADTFVACLRRFVSAK